MVAARGRSGGKNRKSAAVKMLHGNPGGRPIKPDAELPPGVPVMPPYLRRHRRASTIWNEMTPVLVAAGLASTGDSLALGMLCKLLADFERGTMKAAMLPHLRGLLANFGIAGPASRSGLNVRPPSSTEPVPADAAFLRQRGLRVVGDAREFLAAPIRRVS